MLQGKASKSVDLPRLYEVFRAHYIAIQGKSVRGFLVDSIVVVVVEHRVIAGQFSWTYVNNFLLPIHLLLMLSSRA